MKATALLVCGAVALSSSPALAGKHHDEAVKRHGRAVKRGTIAQFRSRMVKVGGKKVRLETLTNKAFKRTRDLKRQFQRAQGLYGGVTSSEEVSELSDRFVITKRTGAIIDDPGKVERASARFKKRRRRAKKKKLAQLDTASKKALEGFIKQKLLKASTKHPLRKAYQKGGKQGLLDAMADGKGYWGITETIVIPKAPPKVDKSGVLLPEIRNGDLVPGKKRRRRRRLMGFGEDATPMLQTQETEVTTELEGPSSDDPFGIAELAQAQWDGAPLDLLPGAEQLTTNTTRTGEQTLTFKFLAGNTWAREWEHTIIIGDDEWTETYFRLYFYAGMDVGLRWPMEVTAQMSPTSIVRTAGADSRNPYSVSLTVNMVDGDAAHYADVGLPVSQRANNKEFALSAEVVMNAAVFVCGSRRWRKRITRGIDEGDNFRPPQSSSFGFVGDVWVPASVTDTDYTIFGYGVTAQVGAKLEASAFPLIDFTAKADGNVVKSWMKNATTQTKRDTTEVAFPNYNGTRTVQAKTTGSCVRDCTKDYGYRIHNPRYETDLRVVPGIKLAGYVDWPLYDSLTDTYWLDWLTIDLDNHRWAPHPNTTTQHVRTTGSKRFVKN